MYQLPPTPIGTPSLLLRLGVDLKISFLKSNGRKSDSKESTAASKVNKSSVTYPCKYLKILKPFFYIISNSIII